MTLDRNALLALLAVRRGFTQPAEVLAAQSAMAAHPATSLAAELVRSGVLTDERARELELVADKALSQAGGDLARALEQSGKSWAGRPPAGLGLEEDLASQPPGEDELQTGQSAPLAFGADDDERTRLDGDAHSTLESKPTRPRDFGDDDDRTSIDLGADDDERTTIDPRAAPKAFDTEDEPTRVLDWDRATRKAVEGTAPAAPPKK